MNRLIGILGILAILGLAYVISNDRNKIDKKLIFWGISLQLFFALLILKVPGGKFVFNSIDIFIKKILDFSVEGSKFLFGNLADDSLYFPSDGSWPGFGFQFAFLVLPTVIFFSSIMSVLYHIGFMQKIIKHISKLMQKTMGTSGAETTSISANIFVGQTEAPLVIKPFISKMTNSELMAIMTGGFATVAGGVMAAYVLMLSKTIPGIAGHLMAASIMSAPAALVIAKIIYPETNSPETAKGDIELSRVSDDGNFLESIGNGATEGMKLALNIAAMLIAFISIVALLNWTLGLIYTNDTEAKGKHIGTTNAVIKTVDDDNTNIINLDASPSTYKLEMGQTIKIEHATDSLLFEYVRVIAIDDTNNAITALRGQDDTSIQSFPDDSKVYFRSTPLSIELILGYLFMPLAFLMGAPWSEAHILGSLMGQKLVLTEFIAYGNLASLGDSVSTKTATIAAYALCGFANFASIGIQLGGIGSIAPERKKDLAKLVMKAMIGGALASWLTATIAGILL